MTVINNRKAYYEAMAEIETYLAKGFDHLTKAEETRLNVLSKAVEAWENEEYPMPMEPDFKDILVYLMETRKLNQSQLSSELQVSTSLVSEIIRGKKMPNLDILINVYKRFQIDGNLLLNSIHLR